MRSFKTIIIAAALIFSGLSAFAAQPIAAQRWIYQSSLANTTVWTGDHKLLSPDESSSISFEGKDPVYGHVGKRKNIAVANIKAGDAFLFTIPVKELPKGTQVDFGLVLGIENGGPTDWVCEYRCGKKWIKAGQFTVTYYKSTDDTEWLTDFVLAKPIKNELCVRVRSLGDAGNPKASAYLLPTPQYAAYLAAWPAGKYEKKKVLCIGNSFTYFGNSYQALLEIARSQGYSLQIGINVKGGQNFGQHLKLERSGIAIEKGGYDIALMQNQSMSGAYYASDSEKYAYLKDDAEAIAAKIREHSPGVRMILERTWAYPTKDGQWKGYGNAEAFDADLQKGTGALAAAMHAELSPIGNAFIKARELGLPIYWKDSFHQNWLGAYLKACVNYLIIFGKPFEGDVSNFGQNPAEAAACRKIATEVVLGQTLAKGLEPLMVQRWSYKEKLESDAAQGEKLSFVFSAPVKHLDKGSEVDFALEIGIEEGGPKDWVCEYLCGDIWMEAGRFATDSYKNDETEWFVSFSLADAVDKELSVRVVSLAVPDVPGAKAYIRPAPRIGAYLAAWPAGEYQHIRVLNLGNSGSFFWGAYHNLREIARSQGKCIDLVVNMKGSQTFGTHLKLPRSQKAIEAGGFDAALLQNLSQSASRYVSDREKYAFYRTDAVEMASEVRKYSPSCRLILEQNQAYPKKDGQWCGYGSAENFDALVKEGIEIFAADMKADISPIGAAFAVARAKDMSLYGPDAAHSNPVGAYLRACVNYLVLFGAPFVEPVADFGIDPDDAAACRKIAAEVVLRN